jgi:all-trans-retinol dehydrogenase (NAD+)
MNGGNVYSYVCDVSNRLMVKEVASQVLQKVEKIDILINNAGIVSGKNILHNEEEELERVIDVNLKAHFWTVKYFLPNMLEMQNGHIVEVFK